MSPAIKAKSVAVWDGPSKKTDNGGITYSLLSRFLCCRERFRLLVVEGIRPGDEFNHRLHFGSAWHVCEQALASNGDWQTSLKIYCSTLAKRYPLQGQQVEHWFNVIRVQFPAYVEFWSRNPDVKARTPLLQEQVFCVPYELPSGRTVFLRGRWDAVDLIGRDGVYLFETKTKGDIDEQLLKRQLSFDLQTMLYLIALREEQRILQHKTVVTSSRDDWMLKFGREPIQGVRYNVVRRPLSGGEFSIRQHKPSKQNPNGESSREFYARLSDLIRENSKHFFMRWKVELLPGDIERFKRECLNPILEQLCDWWEWISYKSIVPLDPFASAGNHGIHFRMPYGIWNATLEGRASEVDEYLTSGSELGLSRTDTLFSELEE